MSKQNQVLFKLNNQKALNLNTHTEIIAGDVEAGKTLKTWTWPAVSLLISQYKDHQDDIDNPELQENWAKISAMLKDEDYSVTPQQAEIKWKSFLRSHKDFISHKSRSGAKCKTFQYNDEWEDIVARRHDMNPLFVEGTGVTGGPVNGINHSKSFDTATPTKHSACSLQRKMQLRTLGNHYCLTASQQNAVISSITWWRNQMCWSTSRNIIRN